MRARQVSRSSSSEPGRWQRRSRAAAPSSSCRPSPPLGTGSEAAKKVDNSLLGAPARRTALPTAGFRRKALLLAWRARSEMPDAKFVNGRYKGTTDNIIEWAAYKWCLDQEVLRAVAVVESWWEMSVVGDNGDPFGLYQVRRPFHCWEGMLDRPPLHRLERRLLRRHHPRLLRRPDALAQHRRTRQGLHPRRPLGVAWAPGLRPLVDPARGQLHRGSAAAAGGEDLAPGLLSLEVGSGLRDRSATSSPPDVSSSRRIGKARGCRRQAAQDQGS